MKTNKLTTVNVIEVNGYDIQEIHAFADTPEGNKEAEELYKSLINENSVKDAIIEPATMEDAIENGFWWNGKDYTVSLVHST